MARIHLFEFEDLSWFPTNIRDYMTDFLQFLSNKSQLYKPIIPILKKGLKAAGNDQILDLGSGGGGGLFWLNQALQNDIPNLKILLSDYYPNQKAFAYTQSQANNFDYVAERVDARAVPEHLKGLRTQFLSLHHFRPDDAVKILQNAVNAKSPIAIFEGQERTLPSIIAMLLSPISVWLTTPFIRPFKLGRILFTYLIPIVPLFVLWDGVVSSFRTYSVKEMQGLIDQVKGQADFDWELGKVKSGPGVVLYLLGTPKT